MRVERLAERDGWICWLCDGPVDPDAPVGPPGAPTVDHVVPKSRGGAGDPGNLRLAHRRCNGRRGNHLPELAWPDELGLLEAPSLWRSLKRIVDRAGGGAGRRRSPRSNGGTAQAEIVALAPTAETGEEAARWAEAAATRFLGGTWSGRAEPTGVADCHVIRLSVEGPVADPGRPVERRRGR